MTDAQKLKQIRSILQKWVPPAKISNTPIAFVMTPVTYELLLTFTEPEADNQQP